MTIRKIKGLVYSLWGAILSIVAIEKLITVIGKFVCAPDAKLASTPDEIKLAGTLDEIKLAGTVNEITKVDNYTAIVWGIVLFVAVVVFAMGLAYAADAIFVTKKEFVKETVLGVNCPACKTVNNKSNQVCKTCGTYLKTRADENPIENTTWECPECGKINKFVDDFCVCGAVKPWRKDN